MVSELVFGIVITLRRFFVSLILICSIDLKLYINKQLLALRPLFILPVAQIHPSALVQPSDFHLN